MDEYAAMKQTRKKRTVTSGNTIPIFSKKAVMPGTAGSGRDGTCVCTAMAEKMHNLTKLCYLNKLRSE
jgi:hypothetical protein